MNRTKNGCLYVSIYYPGYITLKEGYAYLAEIDNNVVSINLRRHLKPIEILDFENSIVEEQDNEKDKINIENQINNISGNNLVMKIDSNIIKVIDHLKYYYRSFTPRLYTEIVIIYELEDPDNISEEEFKFHETVLDYFINIYRMVTRDVKIKRPRDQFNDNYVIKTCTIKYTSEDIELPIEERLNRSREVRFNIKQVKYKPDDCISSDNREDIVTPSIAKYLRENIRFSPAEDLLLKALEEYQVNRNFKYALLDAFIAAETSITEYVNNIKLKHGVSKNKLEDYKTEVGISYMINVELPFVIGNITTQDRQIFGNIDKVRKKRNDVIHEGDSVSENDALFAIEAVFKLLDIIKRESQN